jgi:uridine phosphorylase
MSAQFPAGEIPGASPQYYIGDPAPQNTYPPRANFPISSETAEALKTRYAQDLEAEKGRLAAERAAFEQDRQAAYDQFAREKAEAAALYDKMNARFATMEAQMKAVNLQNPYVYSISLLRH